MQTSMEKEAPEVIHVDEEISDCSNRPKKRRIHMDTSQCFDHFQTVEGALPLSNPSQSSLNSLGPSRHNRLNPVVRNKKRQLHRRSDEEFLSAVSLDNPYSDAVPDACSSGGFVSASDMYNIATKQEARTSTTNHSSSPFKHNSDNQKQKKLKQIRNQGSILSFLKSKPETVDTPEKMSNRASIVHESSVTSLSLQENANLLLSQGKSLMYSPIKHVDNTRIIYISDTSPSDSPSSSCSQGRTQEDKISMKDNPVVKKLFDGQKKLSESSHMKQTKRKSKSVSKPALSVAKQREIQKIEEEAKKYFENDSFDISAAMEMDLVDSKKCHKSASSLQSSNAFKKSVEFSDRYGLLGTGSVPSKVTTQVDETNYFERLPVEILENIFCQLPMLDLCLNCNRVCLQWNEIIASSKFVPWKKLYHKVKLDIDDSRRDMQTLMRKNGMTNPSSYLPCLIRYMKNFKLVTATNMLQCLQKHSKYHWAKALIDERLKDCCTEEGEPNPWCVMTVLVIVSHDVYEIQELIRSLMVSWSRCTALEIIESLYCIASFLYAFKLAKRDDVWNGMHYRLFYALYLYENGSTTSYADLHGVTSQSCGGQQSLIKYSSSSENVRLTHEQLRIVKHQTRDDEIIKIVAFAGTGKTTTLVKYTQLRPDKKFLLVVYNKSVCEHAKTKFPANVTCKTGHSLAFQQFGRRYIGQLYGIKVYTLTQVLPPRKGENLFLRAKNVITTIENYLSSADVSINMAHAPLVRANEETGLREDISPAARMLYVKDAEFVWNRMKDVNDKAVGMSHDGYLKLYQLSRPRLRGYDCILIDEAQDLTPAIIDILTSQPQGKILVGDPHQQIYSFRGAVNAMDSIEAHTIFYLTQSFRFGPEISQVASICLEVLKHERKKTLVGSGKKCHVTGEQVGQLAIISRCNFTVFSEAVKKCCYSSEDCKVAFVGGTENFGFPMLMDMYALLLPKEERIKEGYEIQHKLIKSFPNFGALENFATKSLDVELLGKIKIVKTYTNNLPMHIRKIESKCLQDTRQADYVFSTAHKAKGLEFSTVRVTDDFLASRQAHTDDGMENILVLPARFSGNETLDEENLLYVAVTRAKNALQMSPTLLKVLKHAGESFKYPVLSADLQQKGLLFKCHETDQEFKPKALTLFGEKIVLGDGKETEGRVYSPAILSQDLGSFSRLMGLTKEDKPKSAKDQD